MLLSTFGTRNIDEVCMRKAARLASTAINGDTDVEDIADFPEEIYR